MDGSTRDTLGTIVIAVACVLAVTVTASAVQSTVSKTPDDAINLDPGSLPISERDAAKLEDEIQDERTEPPEDLESGPGGSETTGALGDTADTGPPSRAFDGQVEGRSEGSDDRSTVIALSRDGSNIPNVGQQESAAESDPKQAEDRESSARRISEPTLLQRILTLLEDLFELLFSMLPLVALVALTAVAVEKRERIRDRFRWYVERSRDESDRVGDPDPCHGVDAAWAELLESIERSKDPTVTPADCAAEAVAAGFDPDAVRRLRRLYEEVRYGDRAATRDRERAAWTSLRRARSARSG